MFFLNIKLVNIEKVSYAILEILYKILLIKNGGETQIGLNNRVNIWADVTEKSG